MNNQNALTSTAMLASIWEKEKKDTLELMLPFILHSISNTISVGNKVDIGLVSNDVSENFGFAEIPHSVLNKAMTRLKKTGYLTQEKHSFYLKKDLSGMRLNLGQNQEISKMQADKVITSLTHYMNTKKERIFKKDLTQEEVMDFFVKFLERKGYIVYSENIKSGELSANEESLYYHISQFIYEEYEKKSDLFRYIDNIVKGLLLSKVVFGYEDIRSNEKLKSIIVYLDTTLLLRVFGFKNMEENNAAAQLMKILRENGVSVKCFKHIKKEAYRIVDAYRHNLLEPAARYGSTLEHFDGLDYSADDMMRVLNNFDEHFKKHNIESVDVPSFSSNDSGSVASSDYDKAIGETDLKEYLKKHIYRRWSKNVRFDANSH